MLRARSLPGAGCNSIVGLSFAAPAVAGMCSEPQRGRPGCPVRTGGISEEPTPLLRVLRQDMTEWYRSQDARLDRAIRLFDSHQQRLVCIESFLEDKYGETSRSSLPSAEALAESIRKERQERADCIEELRAGLVAAAVGLENRLQDAEKRTTATLSEFVLERLIETTQPGSQSILELAIARERNATATSGDSQSQLRQALSDDLNELQAKLKVEMSQLVEQTSQALREELHSEIASFKASSDDLCGDVASRLRNLEDWHCKTSNGQTEDGAKHMGADFPAAKDGSEAPERMLQKQQSVLSAVATTDAGCSVGAICSASESPPRGCARDDVSSRPSQTPDGEDIAQVPQSAMRPVSATNSGLIPGEETPQVRPLMKLQQFPKNPASPTCVLYEAARMSPARLHPNGSRAQPEHAGARFSSPLKNQRCWKSPRSTYRGTATAHPPPPSQAGIPPQNQTPQTPQQAAWNTLSQRQRPLMQSAMLSASNPSLAIHNGSAKQQRQQTPQPPPVVQRPTGLAGMAPPSSSSTSALIAPRRPSNGGNMSGPTLPTSGNVVNGVRSQQVGLVSSPRSCIGGR